MSGRYERASSNAKLRNAVYRMDMNSKLAPVFFLAHTYWTSGPKVMTCSYMSSTSHGAASDHQLSAIRKTRSCSSVFTYCGNAYAVV